MVGNDDGGQSCDQLWVADAILGLRKLAVLTRVLNELAKLLIIRPSTQFYYRSTIVVWPVSFDGSRFFVLKSNAVYCSIIFANFIASKYFLCIKLMWKYFRDEWSQIPAKSTDTKRAARLCAPANSDSAAPHHRRHQSFLCISYYQCRQHQRLI
jgi:hypothetical protein